MTQAICRTALYMPANNARAMEKATTLAADAIIIDLEDSVAPNAKTQARDAAVAALQAYEMTERSIWLERAGQMRAKGLEYFYEQTTGTMIEFIAPNLSTLIGRDGLRREVGHQCEWAWLLYREAELGGDTNVCAIANNLLAFADNHGFASNGVMLGAAFDAVSSDKSWHEDRFLLWPQTEAIKTFAIRKDQTDKATNARHLMLLVFQRYFANHSAFVNQLDNTGNPLWSEALSRLLYHLVLALTEGARAGLWKTPVRE